MSSSTLCVFLPKSSSASSLHHHHQQQQQQQQKQQVRVCRDAIYVASMPLRAAQGPPQLLMSAAYSLGLWDLQHFMVIIKPTTTHPTKVIVYDFQPEDPENVAVALAALSRRQVPGVIRKRSLSRLPKTRCWFVGFSLANGVEVADKFSEDWPTDLIIGKHDCRHYTGGDISFANGWVRASAGRVQC